MEWLAYGISGLTALVAVAAFVLGVRAEIRAGYSKLWTVSGNGDALTVLNRTGEDAAEVSVEVNPGSVEPRRPIDTVRTDSEFVVLVSPPDALTPDEEYRVHVTVTWTRPRSRKQYRRSAGTATLTHLDIGVW